MPSGAEDITSTEAMPSRPVYGDFALDYDALFGGVDRACLDFVREKAPPPGALLDAGCGTGHYALALADFGYTVVAVDRERRLIEARPESPAAVDFVLADLRRLPFDPQFDVILARGVLNDFVNPSELARALRALADSLTQHGLFIADVREREAQRARIAKQPVVERVAGGIAFRAFRRMEDGRTIVSEEQFARDGQWTAPFEFRMRTFTAEEVRGLWWRSGLEVISIDGTYGAGSRLTDRLVIVARTANPRRRQSESR